MLVAERDSEREIMLMRVCTFVYAEFWKENYKFVPTLAIAELPINLASKF